MFNNTKYVEDLKVLVKLARLHYPSSQVALMKIPGNPQLRQPIRDVGECVFEWDGAIDSDGRHPTWEATAKAVQLLLN